MWANFDKYFVSLLKSYYGEAATRRTTTASIGCRACTGDHSHFGYWLDMLDGKVEGLFIMGQNPAVGASNGRLERKAMAKLKWLVVRDMVETETRVVLVQLAGSGARRTYSRDNRDRGVLVSRCGVRGKGGTFTNTQRLLQFRKKAVDPPAMRAARRGLCIILAGG